MRPMPGGLAKALEERLGQPFQVVKTCVRGPLIQANDKESLQRYADRVQVAYDTLELMGYLSGMNVHQLARVIARQPKWLRWPLEDR